MDICLWKAHDIKGTGTYQECQCGIKTAGQAEDDFLAVDMGHTGDKSHRLDSEDLLTAAGDLFLIFRCDDNSHSLL